MLLALLLSLPAAEAKDLRSRVGVGFNQQFGGMSTLSARYGLPTGEPTQTIQVEADLGLELRTNAAGRMFAGARVLYTFLAEDNLNLYGAAGAGYAVEDDDGYVRVQPALGAEFFLFGLENLGFSAEWGLSLDVGGISGVTTVGNAPNAAVHYYF